MFTTIEELDKHFEIHLDKSRHSAGRPQRFKECRIYPKGSFVKKGFVVQSVLNHTMRKVIPDEYLIKKANEYYELER